MTDNEIVSLFFKRDEKAISETENKYYAYLMKIAYNILSDWEDSREAVNDTGLRAWNIIPPNKPNKLSAFLAKLTRDISIDKYRKIHSLRRVNNEYALALDELSDVISDKNPTPEDAVEGKFLREIINDFVNSLNEEQRNIFVCRYFFFDSIKDISLYYSISESKVKTVLFRLREKLKETLLKEGYSL